MAALPNPFDPPITVPLVDADTGTLADIWRRYFRTVGVLVSGATPIDGQYLTATAAPRLTAQRNLGLLASGYLKLTVALGIATPSTVATLPASDLTGTLPAAVFPAVLPASSGANLTTLAAAALVGALPAISGAALTTLTGPQIAHAVQAVAFAASPYAVLPTDELLTVDATAGVTVILLPTPTAGRIVTVKKIDGSANAVTVNGNGALVDGLATRPLAAQWNALQVQGDGVHWQRIGVV